MLYGWMKSLIIYLILSGLVMNMTPGRNYKRYINSFAGLIVVIILSEPLSYIFHLSSGDLAGIAESFSGYMDQSNTVEYDNIYNYYEMSLGETIRYDMEKQGYPVERVETTTDADEHILRCTVIISSDNKNRSELVSEMKKYISDVYNVEMDSIYIVRR